MIVKNEAPVIRRCLDSVRPIIDHWIIVDTGSTDGTQDVIRAVLRDVPGEVVDRPWVDFGHNRTEALALARPHGDYSLIIDADDELALTPGFTMPELDADSYVVDIHYGAVTYQRTQMVKNALEWSYRGVLHEFLACDIAKSSGHLPILMRINHEGRRSTDPQTYTKDAAILEHALATETDPFLISRYTFYLAQSYRDCGDAEAAIKAYLQRATLGYWPEEIFVSLLQAGRLMESMGRPTEDVLATYQRATEACPSRAEAAHAASRLCRSLDRFEQGYWIAKPVIDLAAPPAGLFVEAWIYDYGLLDEYAVNAYWAGHYRDCLDACLRALETGKVPPDAQPRFVQNARFAVDHLSDDKRNGAPPGTAPLQGRPRVEAKNCQFDLKSELGISDKSMIIADVGAAFFGEKQLYQPLLDLKLGTLICFEPDPAQVAALEAHLGQSGLVVPCALGDGGEHTLYAADGGMTSLFEPDQEAYNLYSLFALPPFSPVASSVQRSSLKTRRLDDVAEVPSIDFLKIDIQGSELMVLQSGAQKLAGCSVVQIEVPFVPLYKGAPTFGDIDAEMRRQGFMIHGFATIKRLPIHPYASDGCLIGINQLIDLDMIYIKDIRNMGQVSSDFLVNMALIADYCYKSFDLTLRCLTELILRKKLRQDIGDRYVNYRKTYKHSGLLHYAPNVQAPP